MAYGVENQLRPILLVEDSEEDHEAITRAFKGAGLNNPVAWCKSGGEALDFLKRPRAESPCLILLDLNLPGLDGRHVLQILKEDAALKGIPIVIFSTSSNERDVRACYQMGANAYMQKPSSLEGMAAAAESIRQYWFKAALLPRQEGTGS